MQYYEGFKYKDDDYDISKIDIPIPNNLEWNKILTHRETYLQFDYGNITLPSYSYDYSNTVGTPEKLITDDGIVFIPQSSHMLKTRTTVTCVSPNKNNIITGKSNSDFLYAYEPGEYTLVYTMELYDDNGGSVSKSKEFIITAVDKNDHTEHEFSSSYKAYVAMWGAGYHHKICFCGDVTNDNRPHSYEEKAVPYVDGINIYYNQCSICGYYYITKAGGDILLGDINGDGKINNTDIILLGRAYMAGTADKYIANADMNKDGKITNADIILLGRLYMSQKK